MKIITVLGTRPEIIRLSLIIKKLDKYCNHILVHTGQNYDYQLNDIFFKELGVRKPDYYLGVKSEGFGEQIGQILLKTEKLLKKEKPEAILILGDTNSGLVSIIAKRMRIRVFHMEAGNRCYNNLSPEEVNREVIDHSSDILMPYTQRSKENLIREGKHNKDIYVIGNPIYEVLNLYKEKVKQSNVHKVFGVKKGKYFLLTMHREENVDNKARLKNIIAAMEKLQKEYTYLVICSVHPRTKDKIEKYRIIIRNKNIILLKPLGFFEFVALEKEAFCVVSDSGTVQEECCIFKTPNVTIREATERQETVEGGSSIVSGLGVEDIVNSVKVATEEKNNWKIPEEYLRNNVSMAVVKIITNNYM